MKTESYQHPGHDAAAEPEFPVVAEQSRYWVEHRGHAFELWRGPMTIGRAADCTLVLDDGLVSRRHARLAMEQGAIFVEDLRSSNGVFVNGERVMGRRELMPGDQLTIGKQQIVVRGPGASERPKASSGRRVLAETLHSADPLALERVGLEPDTSAAGNRGAQALELLAGVANKTLALGRGDEAEKMLEGQLEKVAASVRAGEELDAQTAERAVGLAVRLAAVTGKGAWIDYAFQLYGALARPLPASVIDQLYEVTRKVANVSLPILREYVATLRSGQAKLGPAEKFLFQRIEGLERLVASK